MSGLNETPHSETISSENIISSHGISIKDRDVVELL